MTQPLSTTRSSSFGSRSTTLSQVQALSNITAHRSGPAVLRSLEKRGQFARLDMSYGIYSTDRRFRGKYFAFAPRERIRPPAATRRLLIRPTREFAHAVLLPSPLTFHLT